MRNKRSQEELLLGTNLGHAGDQICLFFNFAVVFSSMYFRFRQEQTHDKAISMSIGDAQ